MIEIGRLCVKIAGRDAGKKCVVVDTVDKFVLIDGETRRRKCNPAHLEPLDQKLKVKKGDSHDNVVAVFKEIGITLIVKKPKKPAVKPIKVRKIQKAPKAPAKPATPAAPTKPAAKKAIPEKSSS